MRCIMKLHHKREHVLILEKMMARKEFSGRFEPDISKNFDQKDKFLTILMKLKLNVLGTDLSQNFVFFSNILEMLKLEKTDEKHFLKSPQKLVLQSATWSHCKSHNAIEFLVSVYPNSIIT